MRKTRLQSGGSGGIWPDDLELRPLVRKAQQGEPGAIDALLTRLRPLLVEFFEGEVERDAADDLAQDALLRVLRALPKIDSQRAVRYIRRLAQHELWKARSRRARDARRLAPIEVALEIASPDAADEAAGYADLARAVAMLPPKLRGCVLEALRGASPGEIAASNGVSPVTIRVNLFRARARLLSALGLCAKHRQAPRAPNPAPPRLVREGTGRPYRVRQRLAELRDKGREGGAVAASTRSAPPWGRVPRPWRRRARATSS